MSGHAASKGGDVPGQALANAHVNAHGGTAFSQVHQNDAIIAGFLPERRGDVVALRQFL
ncbi:hypothetical protein D9M69_712220 [compost metagenome]